MIRRVFTKMLLSGAALFCSAALAETTNGITTTELPGGGTIAYAQMPKQHSAKDAMGKVLQYIEGRYGARPNVSQIIESKDGNLQEAVYTLTPKSGGGELAGVALVATRPGKPIEGAMMTDQSDRFRKTFGPMLDRLTAQAGAADGGGKTSQSSSASTESGGAQSAPKGPSGPSAPAEALHQTDFGTGSIGLPSGWKIVDAHSGVVRVAGPHGELGVFGNPNNITDPTNPQSRALTGMFPSVPSGSDAVTTFNAVVKFNNRRRSQPAYSFSTVKNISAQGGRSFLLVGDVDFHDGKGQQHTWVQLGISPILAAGSYMMTASQIAVPEASANAEAATVAKMFGSYKVNVGAAMNQIRADNRLMQQTFNESMRESAQIMDSSDRMTQGMSDYLRGDTVVRDTLLNGHARVDDDLADALVEADPNRFEKVPLSGYISGIDY